MNKLATDVRYQSQGLLSDPRDYGDSRSLQKPFRQSQQFLKKQRGFSKEDIRPKTVKNTDSNGQRTRGTTAIDVQTSKLASKPTLKTPFMIESQEFLTRQKVAGALDLNKGEVQLSGDTSFYKADGEKSDEGNRGKSMADTQKAFNQSRKTDDALNI